MAFFLLYIKWKYSVNRDFINSWKFTNLFRDEF